MTARDVATLTAGLPAPEASRLDDGVSLFAGYLTFEVSCVCAYLPLRNVLGHVADGTAGRLRQPDIEDGMTAGHKRWIACHPRTI